MNVLVSDRINSFILYNISKFQPIRFIRSHHTQEKAKRKARRFDTRFVVSKFLFRRREEKS